MRLQQHIILLNWNSSSTALLRHIASAYAVSPTLFNSLKPATLHTALAMNGVARLNVKPCTIGLHQL